MVLQLFFIIIIQRFDTTHRSKLFEVYRDRELRSALKEVISAFQAYDDPSCGRISRADGVLLVRELRALGFTRLPDGDESAQLPEDCETISLDQFLTWMHKRAAFGSNNSASGTLDI
eukprot:m.96017 g.96017  ORF g.96017 m.96017 type:complete len:117 (-) comp18463_c1_seq1:56-406(-)